MLGGLGLFRFDALAAGGALEYDEKSALGIIRRKGDEGANVFNFVRRIVLILGV